MGRLEGKVALISGGARGQGAAEARAFVEEGAKVVFGDIIDENGYEVEAEINKTAEASKYIHLDVTNEAVLTPYQSRSPYPPRYQHHSNKCSAQCNESSRNSYRKSCFPPWHVCPHPTRCRLCMPLCTCQC